MRGNVVARSTVGLTLERVAVAGLRWPLPATHLSFQQYKAKCLAAATADPDPLSKRRRKAWRRPDARLWSNQQSTAA
jgi:hypothetical protein